MPQERRVLIVEDDTIVQLHLRMLLTELGYSISGTATSAEEALASAAAIAPDLVMMDIRLTGERDGIEVARELRSHYDVGIIFVTAYADEETVTRAQEVGAVGYLVKPFGKGQVRAALSTAFLHQGKQRSTRTTVVETAVPAPAPARVEPRLRERDFELVPFGAGARMAIFSHDTLGLGHLQRSLNISRAMTARYPGLSVLLLTGSPAVHRYSLPEGVDYVKLPSVRKVGSERYASRSLGLADEDVLRLRTNILLRSLQEYDPDLLLVDHAPIGMKGEMRPALEWLHQHRPHCVKMLGLRDVIDDPEYVVRLWREQGIYDILRTYYDRLLVYGIPEIFDGVTAYEFSTDLRAKVHFCNYVGEYEHDAAPFSGVAARPAGDEKEVLVTIGGGDGGEAVLESYLQMLRTRPLPARVRSTLLTGPFLPADAMARLRPLAEGLPVEIIDFVPSTSPYMARADLVICTGGYNTIMQTLRYARRALVVPRILHRNEQLLRAKRLAELGLVRYLLPDALTPDALHSMVAAMLADRANPLGEARARRLLRFDGAERLADLCAELKVVPAKSKGLDGHPAGASAAS